MTRREARDTSAAPRAASFLHRRRYSLYGGPAWRPSAVAARQNGGVAHGREAAPPHLSGSSLRSSPAVSSRARLTLRALGGVQGREQPAGVSRSPPRVRVPTSSVWRTAARSRPRSARRPAAQAGLTRF